VGWEILSASLTLLNFGSNFYLYAGVACLACFAIIHYYLYLRLRDTGYNKSIFDFLLVEVPVDYLRLRTKYGWSPWPAYLLWPALVAGLVLFVIGVSKL
jgi:hypothetical protein